MAISFTVSYTFSPNTTISSSQVNTNTSDVAAVFQGLEAKTKSFSNLVVDTTPTLSTDVVIKSYVDKLNNYRRPVLQYSSGTVVNIETGINGTSGQAQILFPDGTLRTDSTTTRINCNLAQVAALSGTAQSGLRTGSQTANTWYAVYAVKVTDSTANFVTVADTTLPTQANYATLNSNFGTNGWVYLGLVRNGDQGGATNVVLAFSMVGNKTLLYNRVALANLNVNISTSLPAGFILATTASAASLTWAYSAGTSGQVLPNNVTFGIFSFDLPSGLSGNLIGATSTTTYRRYTTGSITEVVTMEMIAADGVSITGGSGSPFDILCKGWVDGVLGIGANPIL